MKNIKEEFLDVIKIINDTMSNLSDEQLENILCGKGKLIYVDNQPLKTKEKVGERKFDDLILCINKINTREEVYILIENHKLKKDDLIRLGALVNANILKKDTKQRIIERIVEATVGARLRDEAITGIDISR